MKKGKDFAGIIPPVVTPFTAKDEINETLFRKEVKHLISCGIHGISPGGSTGEGAALKDEELVRLIGIIKEENKKNIPIVAGVIRTSTQAAITTALAAKKAGANALMVTPVFYNILVPDAKGNEVFYRSISEAVDLPIIIYNVVPQNEITSEVFASLLKIKNVVGIKQSLGSTPGMYEMVCVNGSKGMIYSATDEMMFTTFTLGADGAISAVLSLFPKLCMKMWALNQEKKYEEGLKIQNALYPVWKVVRGPQFPARMKAALKMQGRDCGLSRSPMTEVTQAQIAQLKELMKGVDEE